MKRPFGRSLKDLVVAITGASAGIGRAAALAFARAGAKVAVAARRLDRLDQVADEVRSLGGECFVRIVDVADAGQVQSFVEGTAEHFGRLDVLVNNAGYGVRGRMEDTPLEAYDRLMRVNYLGTVYGCRFAVPIMRRQGRGVLLNVSSIVGHRALPNGAAYAATKAAQISLTESLRVELRGTGISVCSVHPIGTETEFGDVADRESGVATTGGAIGPQQSADHVASCLVAAVRHPRPEIYPHSLSRALVWINALAPGVLDWVAFRAARKAGRL